MTALWLAVLAGSWLAGIGCRGDETEYVAAEGLFTIELPDGWSVFVPTEDGSEIVPVLVVGTEAKDDEGGVGVSFFSGRNWSTMAEAEMYWSDRAEEPLEFRAIARKQGKHSRARADGRTADGYPIPAATIDILSYPETSDEPWLVLRCGGAVGRIGEVRDACDRVLKTLEVWDPAVGAR